MVILSAQQYVCNVLFPVIGQLVMLCAKIFPADMVKEKFPGTIKPLPATTVQPQGTAQPMALSREPPVAKLPPRADNVAKLPPREGPVAMLPSPGAIIPLVDFGGKFQDKPRTPRSLAITGFTPRGKFLNLDK